MTSNITSAALGQNVSIKALPPTTIRQLGSSQVLVDPTSIVKELIDNAIDARASAIWIDISSNTIDSIQVKDNGHGIPAEDRALVCRRYCTSKIRDFHDLKEVGGKWLGFRGEAMASMAEISGTLTLHTRVEGEPVAVLLQYGRNGELVSTKRASHPVGSTVKVTDIFSSLPVRKQTALKHSSAYLAKVKRMMQSYALARPGVRLQFRVLKGKTDGANFSYAPNATASVKDAVTKTIGKNCASQCESSVLKTAGYEIHAFLPKATSTRPADIANIGAYISIDSRPVSTTRGTPKKIVALVRDRLRKSSDALAAVQGPFMTMNIICPSGSYDPNIEPAKDDVLFEDAVLLMSAVEELLTMHCTKKNVVRDDNPEIPEAILQEQEGCRPETSSTMLFDLQEDQALQPTQNPPISNQNITQWRSCMYGIDAEDLATLSETQSPAVFEEEEEGIHSLAVSNPWTIARLNCATKKRSVVPGNPLMTPDKDGRNEISNLSSPLASSRAARPLQEDGNAFLPPTPRSIDRRAIVPRATVPEKAECIQVPTLPTLSISPTERSSLSTPPRMVLNDSLRNGNKGQGSGTISHTRVHSPAQSNPFPAHTSQFTPINASRTSLPGQLPQESAYGVAEELSSMQPTARPTKRLKGSFVNKPFSMPSMDHRGSKVGRQKATPQGKPSRRIPIDRGQNHSQEESMLVSGNNRGIESFLTRPKQTHRYPRRSLSMKAASESPTTFNNLAESIDEVGHHDDHDPLTQVAEQDYLYCFGTFDESEYDFQRPPSRPRRKIARRSRSAPHEDGLQTGRTSKNANHSEPHPYRRVASSHLTRSKSSKLPLERIPVGFNIQDLICYTSLPISFISESMNRMGLSSATSNNNLSWRDPVQEVYDALSRPVTYTEVQSWAVSIDKSLRSKYQVEENVNTVQTLSEGIQAMLSDSSDICVEDLDAEEIFPV